MAISQPNRAHFPKKDWELDVRLMNRVILNLPQFDSTVLKHLSMSSRRSCALKLECVYCVYGLYAGTMASVKTQ